MNNKKEPILPITVDALPERLKDAVKRAGWKDLMPVQAIAIPHLLAGSEVMIQARTGSGKTGAFLLPMLEYLDPSRAETQALILVPTRELAKQVWQESQMLCTPAGFRTAAVYGGTGYGEQVAALKEGAHIVVGTPGRILDHLLRRTLSLEGISMLIFDEADRMLSMGFYPDMRAVQRYLPPHDINTCMFSATFPTAVLNTARAFTRNPEFLSLSQDHVHVSEVDHSFCDVPGMDKDKTLVNLIEMENPAAAIIFSNTKSNVHYINVVLQRYGYDADELSADLSQNDRERVLGRIREGTLRFLVATDVAARGIDIPHLSHVIQYEPPEDNESYIHRAGRTGRAGASGAAITLISGGVERSQIDRIAKQYKFSISERKIPTDEEVSAVVTERITAHLEARLRERDKLQAERSKRFVPLARQLAETDDESAVIAMLLDDYYQELLHAPAEGVKKPPERSPEREHRPPPDSHRDNRGGGRPRGNDRGRRRR